MILRADALLALNATVCIPPYIKFNIQFVF